MTATRRAPSWLRTLVRAARSRTDRQDLLWELRRRHAGEPALPTGPIRHVMVICHGNICRSPFAERHLALRCPDLEIRSAGLEAREGDPAQPGALRIGPEFGVDLEDHAAHRLGPEDIDWADLIIGMTGRHRASVHERWPVGREKVRLLGDFLPRPPHAVEDPWGRSDDLFRAVFEQIARANERLSDLLVTSNGPSPDRGL